MVVKKLERPLATPANQNHGTLTAKILKAFILATNSMTVRYIPQGGNEKKLG